MKIRAKWLSVLGALLLGCILAAQGMGAEGEEKAEKKNTPADKSASPEVPVTEFEVKAKKESAETLKPGSEQSGYHADKASVGPLGAISTQEAPYSISTVSSDLIENTQALNSTEALKYLPLVQNNTGGSQITPYFTIRGFTASTWTYNIAVDGIRSFDIYEPLEDKEEIDVLSGVSSQLYGVTSPAGTIDFVLKHPTRKPQMKATFGGYDKQFYTHFDLGGPLSKRVFYRLNLLYGTPGDTGVNNQSQERYLTSGALDWILNDRTTLSLDGAWAKRDLQYAQAIFIPSTTSGVPAAPDVEKNWGASYTGAKDATTRAGAKFNSRLADFFTVRGYFRYSRIDRSYFLIRQTWLTSALNYQWRYTMTAPATTNVFQYGLYGDAVFATGPFKHQLTFGKSWDSFDADDSGARNSTYATTYPANLYSDPISPAYQLPARATSTAQKTDYGSYFATDRISVGSHWSLLAGGTWARVDDSVLSTTATNATSTASYKRTAFTPAVALSYSPVQAVTAYASYGEGLQQGFVAPSGSANAGEVFQPYKSEQVEIGVKAKLGKFNLTTALYRIDQANQFVTGTGAAAIYSEDGSVVNKGIEFTVSGRLIDNLTAFGGMTFLNSEVKNATANVGKTPQGVAGSMGRGYLEYMLPFLRGLTVKGGFSYTGHTFVDAVNLLPVSSTLVSDGGLRYEKNFWDYPTTFRIDVSNIGGKNYWTTRNNTLYLGNPRTISASLSVALF